MRRPGRPPKRCEGRMGHGLQVQVRANSHARRRGASSATVCVPPIADRCLYPQPPDPHRWRGVCVGGCSSPPDGAGHRPALGILTSQGLGEAENQRLRRLSAKQPKLGGESKFRRCLQERALHRCPPCRPPARALATPFPTKAPRGRSPLASRRRMAAPKGLLFHLTSRLMFLSAPSGSRLLFRCGRDHPLVCEPVRQSILFQHYVITWTWPDHGEL